MPRIGPSALLAGREAHSTVALALTLFAAVNDVNDAMWLSDLLAHGLLRPTGVD